jgi:endonuclease/exonuclease/phosphatase family metal-dependent hydrolase
MYRHAFLHFLAWSLVAANISLGDEPPRTIRVLTYNIHHGEGTDRKLDLERIVEKLK